MRTGTGFVRAAGALEVYAAHLERAQQTASWSSGQYARGDRETHSARTAYDADVRRGQAEKAGSEAQGGTYTLTILPFSDSGRADPGGAVKAYTDAKSGLDGFGHTPRQTRYAQLAPQPQPTATGSSPGWPSPATSSSGCSRPSATWAN